MYCINCGSAIPEDKKNCPVCGKGVNANDEQQASSEPINVPPYYDNSYGFGHPQSKSRIAAGLLQIFLGYFGVGRFYLGYTGIAVAQLLVSVFTCGVGGLWGFIDGILILTGDVKTDASGVPLRD